MPLIIERPTNWWEFTNSTEQDPELMAAEAYRLSGVMVPVEMFTDAIYGDHDAILSRTSDALGMEAELFMKLAQARKILWQSPLIGKWVLAKSPENDWTPVAGVYACPLTFRQTRHQ